MRCPRCPNVSDIRTKCFFSLASLSLSSVSLCREEGNFSTIWKYSQLNLEELRGRAVPTFPCLKFPSNGVMPSLSFPFYTWVGETSAHCERGLGLDGSSSLGRAAGYHRIIAMQASSFHWDGWSLSSGLLRTAGVCPVNFHVHFGVSLSKDLLPSVTCFLVQSVCCGWRFTTNVANGSTGQHSVLLQYRF